MRLDFNCHHAYSSGFVLDAQFQFHGRMAALFGPSGSGKTTIVSMMAGMTRPHTGRIQFGDVTWFDSSKGADEPPERRNLGVVFQDHLLFPHRSVRANLQYGQRRLAKRRSPEHAESRLQRIVDLLELNDLLERAPSTLSGGQQRRVAIGRALLAEPQLLLLDEPLSGLDEALSLKIIRAIDQISHHLDMPMVLISHEQALVRRFADEVAVIEAGRVVAHGEAQDTLDRATMKLLHDHPGPTNVLRVGQVRMVDDHASGMVGEQPVYLPRSAWTGEAEAFVEIDPTDIIIAAGEVHDLSTRNRLNGLIRDLMHVRDRSCWYLEVEVSPTQHLWAEVTGDTVRELGLDKGVRVGCLIKATAMRPV